MADIADKILQIRQAVYGKDVRDSIASALEAANEESTDAKRLAETASHVPRIGANGNWETWDTGTYKDTGTPATGPQGQPGQAGRDGGTGEKGDPGPQGAPGLEGPAFSFGDSYNTLEELKAAHPGGDGKGHLVGRNIYVYTSSGWSETSIQVPDTYLKTDDAAAKFSAKSKVVTVNVTAAGWAGSAAPYTQGVTIENVTASSNQEWLPTTDITREQLTALQAANIVDGGQSAGNVILKAYGDKPGIDIPLRVIVRGDM